jgi:hypothetical protein
MIDETFNSNELIKGIEGSLKVELCDAITGKAQEQMTAKNFVGPSAVRWIKNLQRRYYFSDQVSTLNNSAVQDDVWPGVADHLVLSSLTDATDSANEWHMFGKVVGYAGKYNYSGPDLLCGTPNGTLSEATTTYTKWVFDWPTQAANGTIGSVGWMGAVHTYRGNNTDPGHFYSSLSVQDSKTTSVFYAKIARKSSTEYFGGVSDSPTIHVLDQDFTQTDTFSVSAQFKSATTLSGIAWDNTNNKLWVIGVNASNAPIIASYNSSGTLQSGPTTITNRSYTSLTFDGTDLWTLANIGTRTFTFYKISTSGSDIANIPITSNAQSQTNTAYALAYEPTKQYLYVASYDSQFLAGYHGIGHTINRTKPNVAAFDLSGNEVMVPAALLAWWPRSDTNRFSLLHDSSGGSLYFTSSDFDLLDRYQFIMPRCGTYSPPHRVFRVLLDGLGSRALLPSPITKTDTQTLRITYQMDYT